MRDTQLSLLKSKAKASKLASHVKSCPIELRKFKSSVFSDDSTKTHSDFFCGPTKFICAVKIENMSKTCRAYHEVEAVARNIKPDHHAKTTALPEFKEAERVELAKPKEVPELESVPAPGDKDGRFCICNQPYMGGELMFKCEGYCGNWYHPKCLGMHYTEIDRHSKTNERWYCNECYERAYSLFIACSPRKLDGKKIKSK